MEIVEEVVVPEFVRNCPACGKVTPYKSKEALRNANKAGSKCKPCAQTGPSNAMYGRSGEKSATYGRHHSAETKEKLAAIQRGRRASPELRQKLSDMRRGEKHPNYGKHLSAETRAAISKGHVGKVLSKETKAKISAALQGRETYVRTEETKEKLRVYHTGRLLSPETRAKIKANARRGENNHAWKGGVSTISSLIRGLTEYNRWRFSCYNRDKYTCQMCFVKRNDLHCHHIKHFADIREEFNIQTLEDAIQCLALWDTSNGITLCTDCHKVAHKLTREKKMTDEKTTESTPDGEAIESTRLYKLDDNVIGMIREIVQLSILCGNNIVDHLRAVVLEANPEDPRFLTLSPGYVESYNRMIASLNEEATRQVAEQEQKLAKQQDVPPSALDS